MNYSLRKEPNWDHCDCVILGLFADETETLHGLLPQAQEPLIKRLFKDLREAGDFLWQALFEERSLVLLNCGQRANFTSKQLRKYLAQILPALQKQDIRTAAFALPQIQGKSADWQLQQMVLQIDAQTYQLLDFKSQNSKPHPLNTVQIYLPKTSSGILEKAQSIAAGIRLTRKLADLPANICTPTYLGKQAEALAAEYEKVNAKIFGLQDIRELGMGALLAVAQGSQEEPRFIELQYRGGTNKPLVLIGKGITFDSGGLSIKPANAMDEMKYDMAGAASVLGIIKACAALKLPIHVIGLIPSAENLPSGNAVKPGDIITSLSGQTIEVLNTDAEGRLALADALTYAEQFDPQWVIDMATLTGAMVVALGAVYTGFMTEDEHLAKQILAAGTESEDKVWRMPLDEAYQEAIESPLADMINAGFDRSAGAITAACFLSRFSKKFPWAHLDIAGTAWVSGKKRVATGRPVALMIELLSHAANSR